MSETECPYNSDYFLRGKETGVSLYENYRWLGSLTLPMASSIVQHLGIKDRDEVWDFGCARGYVVKALRMLGYQAWGVDLSEWAIQNCDPEVRGYVAQGNRIPTICDWVIAKDVLEHVTLIDSTIDNFFSVARKGIFVVVPLSPCDGWPYTVKAYEEDKTHIHRLSLGTWKEKFMRVGWMTNAIYRLPGVKDNYYKEGWETGNGFLTVRRMPQP